MRYRSSIPTMLLLFCTYYFLKSRFGNVPVAILPFVPFKLVTTLTHRGLTGPDVECSVSAPLSSL